MSYGVAVEAEDPPVHLHDMLSKLALGLYELEKSRITIRTRVLHTDY